MLTTGRAALSLRELSKVLVFSVVVGRGADYWMSCSLLRELSKVSVFSVVVGRGDDRTGQAGAESRGGMRVVVGGPVCSSIQPLLHVEYHLARQTQTPCYPSSPSKGTT